MQNANSAYLFYIYWLNILLRFIFLIKINIIQNTILFYLNQAKKCLLHKKKNHLKIDWLNQS